MGAPQITEPIGATPQVTPAGAPPAAPSPAPAVAPAPASEPAADAPWYSGFTDPELRGFTEVKGLKSAEETVKHYRELEKLVGGPREELVRIPKNAKPEELAPVWDKLGRPATPDDYKLEQVEGSDPAFEKRMRAAMHEEGVTQQGAVRLQKEMNEAGAAQQAAAQQAQASAEAAAMVSLRQKWGPSYDERVAFADKAIDQGAGSDAAILAIKAKLQEKDSPGNALALEFLANIGEKFREAKGVFNDTAQSPGFQGKTLEGLEAELKQRTGDGVPGSGDQVFQKRLADNDPAAMREMDDLIMRIANARDARQRG